MGAGGRSGASLPSKNDTRGGGGGGGGGGGELAPGPGLGLGLGLGLVLVLVLVDVLSVLNVHVWSTLVFTTASQTVRCMSPFGTRNGANPLARENPLPPPVLLPGDTKHGMSLVPWS